MVQVLGNSKARRSIAGLLAIFLEISVWIHALSARSVHASTLASTAIGQNIANWVLDEQNGYIYLRTTRTSCYLFVFTTCRSSTNS